VEEASGKSGISLIEPGLTATWGEADSGTITGKFRGACEVSSCGGGGAQLAEDLIFWLAQRIQV
jgi:hypothetical protein